MKETHSPSRFWIFTSTINPVARLLFRYRISGDIPMKGPVIIAANHNSELDPILFGISIWRKGRKPYFMAKRQLFSVPVLGGCLRFLRQISVTRPSDIVRESGVDSVASVSASDGDAGCSQSSDSAAESRCGSEVASDRNQSGVSSGESSALRGRGRPDGNASSANFHSSLLVAVRRLRAGGVVVVYPEGSITRQADLSVDDLNPGVVYLASITGAPIVCAAQWGAHRTLPYGKKFPKLRLRAAYDVVFCPPLYVPRKKLKEAEVTEINTSIKNTISDALDSIRHRQTLSQIPGKLNAQLIKKDTNTDTAKSEIIALQGGCHNRKNSSGGESVQSNKRSQVA